MMINIVMPGLLLLSGICVYAGVNHLTIALRRPLERTHLLFAIMCLLMVPSAISHALALQAGNISEFISALRWNLTAMLLFFLFFPWFIAFYTGKRPLPLIVGMNALFAVLFVVNQMLPYSIQYDRLDGIRVLYLPWGEAVTLGVGHNSLWAYIAIPGVLMAFGYALYALGGLYRRDRRRTNLCMMLAIGLSIVSSIEGILVRLSVIDFIHLGPFGFLTVVLVMSVTLTYETRQRLHNSERRFRSLMEQSPFSIQLLSPNGQTLQVNKAWEKLWDVKSDALAGYNILQDQQLIDEGVMHYVEKGFAGEAVEIPPIVYNPADNPLVRGPVRDRWVRAYIYSIKDTAGMVNEVILMHEEVTERKRAEEERAFLANITEHAADAIVGLDLNTNIISWNRGAEMVFGYLSEEIIGKPWSIVVPPEAQEVCRERFKKATLEGFVKAVKTIRIAKGGRRFPAEMTLTALRDEKGGHIGFVAITRDITEQKSLEEQLRHAQKMEAIGQLAGGIAHDFNNILSAITGFGSLIEMNMKEDDPNRIHLKEMLKAGERGAQLTRSLLAFSRKQIIDLKPQNLNEIIKDVEKFLRRIIGEDIKLKTSASAKNLTILADRGQIEQVLMNLATNARDAMPKGGELTIETAIIQIDKEYIKNHNYGEHGMYALLSVTDSGMGMDEKTRQKIFEPFFTTKEMGRGTGLGLAMIYGIVKQHDGYIDVYSVPEKGTTFRIYLPLINLEAKEKATAAPTVYPKGGTETVLVAEDDEAVRKITNDMLKRFGYKVITAVDGEDAIRKFRENKDEIKLLLLDVIMPKKNGKEAYEEIRKIKPDIKTIFLSGYMADLMDKKGILNEGLNLVLKPASPKELLRKVREVLDSLHTSAH